MNECISYLSSSAPSLSLSLSGEKSSLPVMREDCLHTGDRVLVTDASTLLNSVWG